MDALGAARHAGHRLSPTRNANAHVEGGCGKLNGVWMINKPVFKFRSGGRGGRSRGDLVLPPADSGAAPARPRAAQTPTPAEPPAENAHQHPLPGGGAGLEGPLPSLPTATRRWATLFRPSSDLGGEGLPAAGEHHRHIGGHDRQFAATESCVQKGRPPQPAGLVRRRRR